MKSNKPKTKYEINRISVLKIAFIELFNKIS